MTRLLSFLLIGGLAFAGCDKLQDGYDYEQSFYSTELNMSVMEFMQSRRDMFSGMLAASYIMASV